MFSQLFNLSRRRILGLHLAERLDAFMGGFDVAFAFYASQRNLLGRHALGLFNVTLLRLVNYDSLKLFFLIEKVGHIKKRVALESDVNKSRLHAGQHAHDAPLINVADNSLIAFAAFDVKLGHLFVLDDRDLLFTSIDAYD